MKGCNSSYIHIYLDSAVNFTDFSVYFVVRLCSQIDGGRFRCTKSCRTLTDTLQRLYVHLHIVYWCLHTCMVWALVY